MIAEAEPFHHVDGHKVAEIVQFAERALRSRCGPSEVTRLRDAIRDLEGQEEEDFRSAALNLAPDTATKRLIQRSWEATAETTRVGRHGHDSRIQLFTVAFIVQTEDGLTPTEFDELLTWSLATQWGMSTNCCQSAPPIWRISTALYAPDALLSLKLHQVRTWARSFASAEWAPEAVVVPSNHWVSRGLWRAHTFARCLVGMAMWDSAHQKSAGFSTPEALKDRLRRTLATLPFGTKAQMAIFDGSFYETLWRGLNRYQAIRVREHVMHSIPRNNQPDRVIATLSAHQRDQDLRVHLGIFGDSSCQPIVAYAGRVRPYTEFVPQLRGMADNLRLTRIVRARIYKEIYTTAREVDTGPQVVAPNGQLATPRFLLRL